MDRKRFLSLGATGMATAVVAPSALAASPGIVDDHPLYRRYRVLLLEQHARSCSTTHPFVGLPRPARVLDGRPNRLKYICASGTTITLLERGGQLVLRTDAAEPANP